MALKELGESENGGFTFYWKIKHFSLCFLLNRNSIISPVFRVEEMDNTEWSLYLCPEDNADLTLIIQRQSEDEGPEEISVDVKLFFLKTNGDKLERIVTDDFDCDEFSEERFRLKRSEIFEFETLFLHDDTLTVGCFIKEHMHNLSLSTECTAYTEISTETFSFMFPFNVSQQQQIRTLSKTSVSKKYPVFEIVSEPISSTNESGFIAIKITMNKWKTDVLCKCKLSVENKMKKTVFFFEGCHNYLANKDDQSWTLTNSATSNENMRDVSKDSSFVLRFVMEVSDGTHSSYIKDLIYPASASQIKNRIFSNLLVDLSLKEKLNCLRADSRLCDFTLQVKGEEFRVHKAVLGAVSPVFCAMFELEMREKQNSVSVIEDIDADTMRKLISFAYTESMEIMDWQSAIDLYSAADKYQISELKRFCAISLITDLTIENVTEVLSISDMYQDCDLERKAGDFVFENANKVFRSENWNTFMESKMAVANKIMQNMCLKFSSNDSSS